MRVPLSWLRELAPVEVPVDELTHTFNGLGLVVEGVERVGEGLDDVVVGRVAGIRPIPGADKIRLVDVDPGTGDPLEVVCGAWNFEAGDLVPLAPVGAVLPGGFEIGRRKLKGVVSNGMICSAQELGLGTDHRGIMVLPDGLEPGTPFVEAMGITRDVVFDLAIETNRPDAMSMLGIARDVAAKLKVELTPPQPSLDGTGGDPPPLTVEARDLCPGFFALLLPGVQVGPSPGWMAARLTLAGMRPINNIVDISNYVMLELGQPNHPYDRDRLGGGGLLVRRARPGEMLVTLDEVERRLQSDDCLICDAEGAAVGIGGIMGGSSSEIAAHTSTVLLEAAWFQPMAVARTAKRLGLRTEASARFEKGVDPDGIERAVARFAELATAHAGARIGAQSFLPPDLPRRDRVHVRTDRVNAILGTDLDVEQVRSYLDPIGFSARTAGGDLEVAIPSWRLDSTGEIDVIEEVARHHGYANIPRTRPPVKAVGALTAYQRERRYLRHALAGFGLWEAWTTSLLAPGDLEAAGLDPDRAVEITNPLVKEESLLRPSMRPGLLRALQVNASARIADVHLFEMGQVFLRPADPAAELPDEREYLAVAMAGADAHHAASVWMRVLDALGIVGLGLEPGGLPGLHPTRSSRVVSGDGAILGHVGEIDPDVLAGHDLAGRVGWWELDLARLLAADRRPGDYRPVSRYPSSDIDLAFEVDEATPAAAVLAALRSAGGKLLVDVHLFDVFRGPPVGEGRRSLAFRLRFNALDHTLTDEEVAELRRHCIDAVESSLPARLRG